MNEHHESGSSSDGPESTNSRLRRWAVIRAACDVFAGIVIGVGSHNIELGITAAAAADGILRDVFPGK